jgi:hypothetical protein
LAERGNERSDFNRIAERSSRTVRFDVGDLLRINLAVGERAADQCFLSEAVGHGESAARPVLIDGRAANHRENAIACSDRVRESFENDDAPQPSLRT